MEHFTNLYLTFLFEFLNCTLVMTLLHGLCSITHKVDAYFSENLEEAYRYITRDTSALYPIPHKCFPHFYHVAYTLAYANIRYPSSRDPSHWLIPYCFTSSQDIEMYKRRLSADTQRYNNQRKLRRKENWFIKVIS